MKENFLAAIAREKIFTLDGATGSNLAARGLPAGALNEQWVIEKPQEIQRLASDFIAAGSDVILTCTFCAIPLHLEKSVLAGKGEELNTKAVQLAKQAAAGKDVFIAGSMGPVGELMEPFGTLSEKDLTESFAQQAAWLDAGGVDLLVIETQYSVEEAVAALKGARSVSSLPVVVSFSYDRGVRTMMGAKVPYAAETLTEAGADLIGINCGKSLEDNTKCLEQLREATDLPIWFKPNAGLPELKGNVTTYSTTPQDMADHVSGWIERGAKLIGGCCGSSPEHIQAIHRAITEA